MLYFIPWKKSCQPILARARARSSTRVHRAIDAQTQRCEFETCKVHAYCLVRLTVDRNDNVHLCFTNINRTHAKILGLKFSKISVVCLVHTKSTTDQTIAFSAFQFILLIDLHLKYQHLPKIQKWRSLNLWIKLWTDELDDLIFFWDLMPNRSVRIFNWVYCCYYLFNHSSFHVASLPLKIK